ncbi:MULTISPECIES: hypothetical protein [unclassified Serratia (in: enterobacteria)]|uniref:hypothetical protein n=1 Tax=unclassified Serratia (in: enterobacteria) TaxID=2647522 RepID=UPI0030764BB2
MDLICCTKVFDNVMMDRPSAFCRQPSQAKGSGYTQGSSVRNGFVLLCHFIHRWCQHHAQGMHDANFSVFYIKKLLSIFLGYALRLPVIVFTDKQLQTKSDIFSLLQRGMRGSEWRLKHSTLSCI